jgi:hypothetical protein
LPEARLLADERAYERRQTVSAVCSVAAAAALPAGARSANGGNFRRKPAVIIAPGTCTGEPDVAVALVAHPAWAEVPVDRLPKAGKDIPAARAERKNPLDIPFLCLWKAETARSNETLL